MSDEQQDPIKIVVLQRGWVVVGRYRRQGTRCSISSGFVVRRWGTTRGLGEIAAHGPTESTKLDPLTLSSWHELTEIMAIECGPAWAPVIDDAQVMP